MTKRAAQGGCGQSAPTPKTTKWKTTVETTQPIQGLYLVRSLQRPDGIRVEVSRWEPTDPLPGWPLDSP